MARFRPGFYDSLGMLSAGHTGAATGLNALRVLVGSVRKKFLNDASVE